MSAVLGVELSRCGLDDTPEIAALLNRVWGATYGPTGCPLFTADYLRWLYGGPDAASTALLGVRVDGELRAFKAALSRPALLDGHSVRAFQATHLTLDPTLPLAPRLGCLQQLATPHLLVGHDALLPDGPLDLGIAFFEEKKTILQNMRPMVRKHAIARSVLRFQQAIVDPRTLRPAVARGLAVGLAARPVVEADLPALSALHARVTAGSRLALTATVDQLRHRLFGLGRSGAWLVEEHGAPTGFLQAYILDTVRGASSVSVAVVELLAYGGSADAAAVLLEEAVQLGRRHGARGVVMENATMVAPDAMRALGLVPSARRMVMALLAREGALPALDEPELGGAFYVDVK